MRIDLFDLIEGFFSGVIYFLYNAIYSAVQLIRHPFKAPLRLYLRHRSRRTRQMSGLTFLFLVFFVLMVILEFAGYPGTKLPDAARALLDKGDFGSIFWPITLAALISTTGADAVLRLFLRMRMGARKDRAEATINAVEFALFWPIFGIAGVWLTATLAIPEFGAFDGTGIMVQAARIGAALSGLALFLACPSPPLAQLRSGLRRRRRARPRWVQWIGSAAGVGGLNLLAVVALTLGMLPAALRMQQKMETIFTDMEPRGTVDILEMRCQVLGAQPYVDALIVSRRRSIATFLAARDPRVRIWRPQSTDAPVSEFTVLHESAGPVLLRPDMETLVSWRVQPNPAYVFSKDDRCTLSAPIGRDGDLFDLHRQYPVLR